MSNETTENFWLVWNTFEWPANKNPSYRLYYNDDGTPKCYSMEELPYKYIEVDAETFAKCPANVRVVKETIHYITPSITVRKLVPDQNSGVGCHPHDVCVIVPTSHAHTLWNIKTYETH